MQPGVLVDSPASLSSRTLRMASEIEEGLVGAVRSKNVY
jgi:hypothetical protein